MKPTTTRGRRRCMPKRTGDGASSLEPIEVFDKQPGSNGQRRQAKTKGENILASKNQSKPDQTEKND